MREFEKLNKAMPWIVLVAILLMALLIIKNKRPAPFVVEAAPPMTVRYGHHRCDKFDQAGKMLALSIEQAPSVNGPWTHACVYQ